MKNKTLRLLLIGATIGIAPTISSAQTWDGSSISTTTSTGTPQVGIGTASPTADLEINHTSIYNSSTPPGTGFGTIMKIESIRDFGSITPSSIPGTDYNILEINHTDLFSSTGSPFTFFSVNTNGDVHVKRNMAVDAILDANALRANTVDATAYVNVGGLSSTDKLAVLGDIHLGHATDGYRGIKAYSTNGGIRMLSGSNISDGSSITLHSENPGGYIEFNSIGHSEMGSTAFMFSNVDPHAASMTPIMLMEKNGDVTISKLGTGSTQMVIADLSGKLGTQAIPAAQVLSISGSSLSLSGGGGTVTIPSSADNLGNHTATATLQMANHSINNASGLDMTGDIGMHFHDIIGVDNVAWGNSMVMDGSGSSQISIGAGGSQILFKSNGEVWSQGSKLTSDKRFKKDIVELKSRKDELFKLNSYSYNFNREAFKDRNFDSVLHFGFLAQEIATVYPNLTEKGKDGYYAVNYIEFIPLLLQALKEEDAQVQEQQKTINGLKAQIGTLNTEKQAIEEQKAKIAALENKLATLEANMDVCCQSKNGNGNTQTSDNGTTGAVVKSTLEQNIPNPFGTETKIGFHIVGKYQTAFIGIYNLNGEQISKIPVQQGSSFVMVSAGQLKPGMYVYSLVVDNDLIDSKKMVVSE